jgi:hypothetical protein
MKHTRTVACNLSFMSAQLQDVLMQCRYSLCPKYSVHSWKYLNCSYIARSVIMTVVLECYIARSVIMTVVLECYIARSVIMTIVLECYIARSVIMTIVLECYIARSVITTVVLECSCNSLHASLLSMTMHCCHRFWFYDSCQTFCMDIS